MKDQYFGDINDYLKYAFLRALGLRLPAPIMVSWMLTPDDGRSDGSLTRYLQQPERYRAIDPPLFDTLRAAIDADERSVQVAIRSRLITNASYYAAVLPDSRQGRADYFAYLWGRLRGHCAVFFDPDNGFAVRSVAPGRRNSSKYLYWEEFGASASRGFSTIVYQHFPRVNREEFLTTAMGRIKSWAPATSVHAVYGSRVAYLASVAPEHELAFNDAVGAVKAAWGSDLRATRL